MLKVESFRLYDIKYMITSTPTTKKEICAFIATLVLQLLSRKAIFTNRKDNGSY